MVVFRALIRLMSTKLYLDFVRHGIAEECQPNQSDADRSLTELGQQRTQTIARRLKLLGWNWQIVLTSPLVRATQTATLLQAQGLTETIQEFPPLAPGGSFQELMEWQTHHPEIESLALVGHQPDLSEWIQRAIWGEGDQTLDGTGEWWKNSIQLKKAGVARVEFPQGQIKPQQGILTILLTPKVLLKS